MSLVVGALVKVLSSRSKCLDTRNVIAVTKFLTPDLKGEQEPSVI